MSEQPTLNEDAQASMSEVKEESEVTQMPAAEDANEKGEIPSAYDVSLEDILPINPRLFSENRWGEYFKRLRAEDPVHFNQTDMAGRFWSLTKYEDIKQVDTDWGNFSSAEGITLGFPVGAELPEGTLPISTFIAQDPPTHDTSRRSVAGVAAPGNLAKM